MAKRNSLDDFGKSAEILLKCQGELRTKLIIGVIRLNMSFVEDFIKDYKKTYAYIEQKRIYEKYLEKVMSEKENSKLIDFFTEINNLFRRNSEEMRRLEDLSVLNEPDTKEELFNELRKYFAAKKHILTKDSADVVEKLKIPSSELLTTSLLWTVKGEALLEREKNSMGEKDSKDTKDVKSDIDEAIDCFKNAIKLDEEYALAHLGLANALFKKHKDIKNNEMINALEKAQELGSNAQVAEQYGYMYQQYGNIEKAVSYYEEAICWDPCMLTSLRFLKSYYCDKMQTDKALKILARVKNIMPDDDPDINFLRGSILLKEREYLEAEKCLNVAHDSYELLKDSFLQSLSKELLNEIKGDDETRDKLQKSDNPVAKVLWQTIEKRIDYTVFHNQEKFLDFIAPKLSETVSHDITFEVLRRWNSYTPIVADNYYASRGGGYFIKIKGKGIVVDPGFNFIDNFREAGHKFHEIDVVLITHAHNDHTADLESILTLLYRYNKEFEGENTFNRENTIRAEMAWFKNKPIRYGAKEKDRVEKEVEEFIKDCKQEYKRRKKIIDLFLTKSTMDKYNGLLNLRSDKDYRIHIIEAEQHGDRQSDKNYTNCDRIKFDANRITIGNDGKEKYDCIRVIAAKHDDIVSDRDSVGFVFEFTETNSVLIITGDTGWSKEIKKQYSEISDKYKKDDKKIILVAHLGGFHVQEGKYVPNEKDEEAEINSPPFYEHHLGRLGLASLIKTIEPDYCFISEFGEEFKGIRIELARIFSDVFKKVLKGKYKDKCTTMVIMPVDNGFKYDIVNDKVNVITKVDSDKCQITYDYLSLKDVEVGTFYRDYSLQYYDKEKVSENDVMQALAHEFEKKRY